MDKIKWCHLSDAHLGYRQYNLNERLKDFGNAFYKCIIKIIELNPDFVLFTGDLFEHYNPMSAELRQAVSILRKLKENNIPIYVISGNHDVSLIQSKRYGGDVLHLLQDLKLINYLEKDGEPGDYKYIMKNGEPIALVAGLRYYTSKTATKLKEFYTKYKSEFERDDILKILMLHAYIDAVVREKENYDISAYTLNSYPFDYIAMGHYHIKWPKDFSIKRNKIFYPGATEHRNANEWGNERGFIYVEAEKNNGSWIISPKFYTIPVRDKLYIKRNFGLTTAQKVTSELIKIINENDKDGIILKIKITGKIKSGEQSLLNLNKIKNMKKKALFIDIVNNLTISTPVDEIIENLTGIDLIKIYKNVLKNNFNIKEKFSEHYIDIFNKFLNIYDEKNFAEVVENSITELLINNKDLYDSITIDEKLDKKSKQKDKSNQKKEIMTLKSMESKTKIENKRIKKVKKSSIHSKTRLTEFFNEDKLGR